MCVKFLMKNKVHATESKRDDNLTVFWDIENMPIPNGCRGFDIVHQIRQTLNTTLDNIVAIGNLGEMPSTIRKDLQDSGVVMMDSVSTKPSSSDIAIIVEMVKLLWTKPKSMCLISSDSDFTKFNHFMRSVGCHVILIHGRRVSQSLLHSATTAIEWDSLVSNVRLLPKEQSRTIRNSETADDKHRKGKTIVKNVEKHEKLSKRTIQSESEIIEQKLDRRKMKCTALNAAHSENETKLDLIPKMNINSSPKNACILDVAISNIVPSSKSIVEQLTKNHQMLNKQKELESNLIESLIHLNLQKTTNVIVKGGQPDCKKPASKAPNPISETIQLEKSKLMGSENTSRSEKSPASHKSAISEKIQIEESKLITPKTTIHKPPVSHKSVASSNPVVEIIDKIPQTKCADSKITFSAYEPVRISPQDSIIYKNSNLDNSVANLLLSAIKKK
jgi:hypothetical protein